MATAHRQSNAKGTNGGKRREVMGSSELFTMLHLYPCLFLPEAIKKLMSREGKFPLTFITLL